MGLLCSEAFKPSESMSFLATIYDKHRQPLETAAFPTWPEAAAWLLVVNVLFGSKMEDSLLGLWIRRKSLEQKAKIEELSQQRQPQ